MLLQLKNTRKYTMPSEKTNEQKTTASMNLFN